MTTKDNLPQWARTDAGELTVTITNERCQDIMSREDFEARVLVELGETTYDGCGRELR